MPGGAPRAAGPRRRGSNQQGAEEMEPRRAGAGEPGPLPPGLGRSRREMPRLRRSQSGDGRRLEAPRRFGLQGRRGPEVMLMVGHPLLMAMPMDQGLREPGPLHAVPVRTLRVPMMPEGMRSQPQQLRHGGGQKEKGGGEGLAKRHARIVAQGAVEVKRGGETSRRLSPAMGSPVPGARRPGKASPRGATACSLGREPA